MKPAHERSQECLPPKKRDLAQSTVNIEEPPKVDNSSTNNSSTNEPSSWPRGVLVAAGQGHGVRYEVSSEGTEAVTVDQYGNLYKLAVPSATFSSSGLHPVVNMASIPPSFNVASPLIQHPGITYPPIHYAPISHTSVQFLGSPYAVPYAVPPGFLQRAVISPPATLAASHVPHYVPYNSVLSEGVSPPPQTPSPHSFNKATSAQSPPVLMGVVPLDVTKGRVPVFYQHSSQLPTSYPVHEMLLTCPSNTDHNPASRSDKEAMLISTNGAQRGSDCVSDRRGSQVEHYVHSTVVEVARGHGDNLLDCDTYSGYGAQRSEVTLMTHRSTPDTDLEVQRVVGGMVSQEFGKPSIQRKERMSPLNLSSGGKNDTKRGNKNPTSPLRGEVRGVHNVHHAFKYTEKNALISNGESVQGTVYPAETLPSEVPQYVSKTQGSKSPGIPSQDAHSERDCPPVGPAQPPHSTSIPSHFMKGAIIQLATGELKRVEDLQTQDFVRSAEVSGGLKIDSSTVVDIQDSQWSGFVTLQFVVGEQQSKVCLDVPPEHPFFVYGQGWSSCNPSQTAQRFALPCHRLQVGDVCISISLQSVTKNGSSPANQTLPHPIEKSVLQSRECSVLTERDSDRHNQRQKEGVSPRSQTTCPLPTTPSSWSNPGVQRCSGSGQSTESRPSPSRHSFIPQEVKLSIEGRSNAGK